MRKQKKKLCKHCNKYFNSGAGLALHMRSVNGEPNPGTRRKGIKLSGLELKKQQQYARNAQKKSPSGRNAGRRFTLTCFRPNCDNTFQVVESKQNTRKYCSKSCLGMQEGVKTISRYRLGKWMGHFSEELGFWCRSKWESGYMIALKDAGVKFEYEPLRFDLGDTTWTPDIRLTGTKWFIEIKGYDPPESKLKRKKFKQMYPEYKLKVIFKQPNEDRCRRLITWCREKVMDENGDR